MTPLHRRSALIMAVVVLMASWLTAYGFTLWRLHQAALDTGLGNAVMHARNFEKHLTHTLEVIEVMATGLEPQHSVENLQQRFSVQFGQVLAQAPFLRSVSLIDQQGVVIASSTPANVGSQVDTRDFYPHLDPESAHIRIGSPWEGRDIRDGRAANDANPVTADSASFIPVLRRVSGNNGAYWVVAAINPDYFYLHFSSLVAPDEGHIQLLRLDGKLLMSTRHEERPGQRNSAGFVHQVLPDGESGAQRQVLPNGPAVLSAFRTSRNYPVLVAVHIDETAVLAHWAEDARRITFIVLPILLALTAAFIFIRHRKLRLDAKERELATQRRLAESVFQATSDSVLLTNPAGEMIAVNPAFERLNGYSAREALGQKPRIISSGQHSPAFYQALWHSIATTGHWHGEVVNRRKDGSLYTGLLDINAVLDENGQVMHYVGVTADISENKRHEAELLAAKERAEAASMAKTTFLATMSHELRTPMNGVLGMTELLLHSTLTEKQARQLRLVHDSARTLLNTLNEILDYSGIETHELKLDFSEVDPRQLVHELAALFQSHAQAKSLALHSAVADDLPASIRTDPVRLRQALSNLIANAIKFTHRGQIEVHAQASGRDILFSVKDTGIGIPAEQQAQIFEPFVQGDGSFTRNYGGSGLSLTISQRLATLLGGELLLESTPGVGSCFTLRLPLTPEKTA